MSLFKTGLAPLAAVLLFATSLSWAGKEFPQQPGEQTVANQFLVKTKPAVPPAAVVASFLPNAQVHATNLKDVYILNLPATAAPQALSSLAAHAQVEYLEPDRIRHVIANPNDPNY